MQIYDETAKKYKYCMTYSADAGPYATSPFLEDFDKDGSIDIGFFNESSHNIRIVFNKVPAKPISSDGILCYDPVTKQELKEQKQSLMFGSIWDSRLDKVVPAISVSALYPGVEFDSLEGFNVAPG